MDSSPSPYALFIHAELQKNPVSVVRVLELVLRHALVLEASDVHMTPQAEHVLVRFRIDGMLSDAYRFPSHIQPELLARIKILGGLRIDEHATAQDGRFCFSTDGQISVDIRVCVTPSLYGEGAVLRILNTELKWDLDMLGFTSEHQELIHRCFEQTHGLILLAGPTGSGKTSTFYTFLRELCRQEISIVTIEDPVESALEGITQIQVNTQTQLSFANGLRSILRQDPNVIGIGEIRDTETAQLAVHAALTGHLVLSTIHASDAINAIPRLEHLGVEPYLLASSLVFVVAQRLVRKMCTACRKQSSSAYTYNTTSFESTGCATCNGQGKRGRIGVYEVLYMDSSFRKLVADKASTEQLRAHRVGSGMRDLVQDAHEKVRMGVIAPEEMKYLYA